ncbi:MAG: histidine phosphatase family protein [Thermodesulfobacteriota bacterium]
MFLPGLSAVRRPGHFQVFMMPEIITPVKVNGAVEKRMTAAQPYGHSMARLLNDLYGRERVSRLVVVMRHSARRYAEHPAGEPFMELTEEGKDMAYAWGRALPLGAPVSFFSSFIGRCIETAYLIDKGHVAAGGRTRHPVIERTLSPYYVRNASRFLEVCKTFSDFFGQWFAGRISPDIIDPPSDIARQMNVFWNRRLDNTLDDTGKTVDICVTHDWNLFVAREYLLGLAHDAHGDVAYLDGVIVFEEDRKRYIVSPDSTPVALDASQG